MQVLASRAGRWPLALIVVLAALAVLAGCTDEPMTLRKPPSLTANAGVKDTLTRTVIVTNTSGGSDVGSLHWAADQIRSLGGTINFDPALGGKTITLDSGLYLPQDTYIFGTPKGITIRGKGQFRLITSRALVDLHNVTLTDGYADYGSAIQAPRVTLMYSTVKGNRGGPAIFAEKAFHMYNSTVTGNTVAQPAIFWLNGSHVEIEQSTVAFNSPGAGIGMFDAPNRWADVTLRNAVITNNGTPQQNCHNTIGFTYEGANISNDWSCGEVGITVADPQLLPLAKNGGPNMTHAIPHTSPAYNAGVGCHRDDDQRHMKRDAKCDIGAFELGELTGTGARRQSPVASRQSLALLAEDPLDRAEIFGFTHYPKGSSGECRLDYLAVRVGQRDACARSGPGAADLARERIRLPSRRLAERERHGERVRGTKRD